MGLHKQLNINTAPGYCVHSGVLYVETLDYGEFEQHTFKMLENAWSGFCVLSIAVQRCHFSGESRLRFLPVLQKF